MEGENVGLLAAHYQMRAMEKGLSLAGIDCRSQWAAPELDQPTALAYPTPPCPSPGGRGVSLAQPKIFVAAHRVVVAKPPPKSATQSIPAESGEHLQDFKVKWSRTKKFYTKLIKE